MLKRYPTAPGAPSWIELQTDDVRVSASFYGGVFHWDVVDTSPGVREFVMGGLRVGGCRLASHSSARAGWLVYLEVPDLSETLVSPASATHVSATAAHVIDSVGARVGLAEPGGVSQVERVAEPGAPCWFEMRTNRFTDPFGFYVEGLSWPGRGASGEEPHRHASHGRGHSQRTLIIEDCDEVDLEFANRWWVHFGTADVAATLTRIEELGGRLIGTVDTAGDAVMATVEDPFGARFRLVQMSAWPVGA